MLTPPSYRGDMDDTFGRDEARRHLVAPDASSDKYSRGVVGFVTGSARYPGAAVLGVEAALRTGVGMVRYVGDQRPSDLVLMRRPEAVTAEGRVQAWVLGSGQDAGERDDETRGRLERALAAAVPTVIDSGALDLVEAASGPVVITPHAGELARMTGRDRAAIEDDPVAAARDAAERWGVVVLLKGSTTRVASPGGALLEVRSPTPWLATAGSGDALAGVLGALLATSHSRLEAAPEALGPIAAAAAVLHGLAAHRARPGGPVTILELCDALPDVVAELLADA